MVLILSGEETMGRVYNALKRAEGQPRTSVSETSDNREGTTTCRISCRVRRAIRGMVRRSPPARSVSIQRPLHTRTKRLPGRHSLAVTFNVMLGQPWALSDRRAPPSSLQEQSRPRASNHTSSRSWNRARRNTSTFVRRWRPLCSRSAHRWDRAGGYSRNSASPAGQFRARNWRH